MILHGSVEIGCWETLRKIEQAIPQYQVLLMPANLNHVPGPPKPPSPGRLLHEIRASSDPEIRQGRNLVLLIVFFLVFFAAARLAICHLMLGVPWIPVQIARLVVVIVLSICLVRGLSLAQVITAVFAAAAFLDALVTFCYGATNGNMVATTLFSVGGMLGYFTVAMTLLLSAEVRRFARFQRARKRLKQAEREKQNLCKLLQYQTSKIKGEQWES